MKRYELEQLIDLLEKFQEDYGEDIGLLTYYTWDGIIDLVRMRLKRLEKVG